MNKTHQLLPADKSGTGEMQETLWGSEHGLGNEGLGCGWAAGESSKGWGIRSAEICPLALTTEGQVAHPSPSLGTGCSLEA